MKEKMAQLDKLLGADAGLLDKMFAAESAADVQELFKAQGLEFTLDEIDILKASLVKQFEEQDFADGKLHFIIPDAAAAADELSDDDLENVAGGVSRGMSIGIVVAYGIPRLPGVPAHPFNGRW